MNERCFTGAALMLSQSTAPKAARTESFCEHMTRKAAIALGNFDGVHLGHQAVIASARVAADALECELVAAVFEPHPRRFFAPDTPPFRLQTKGQRERALRELGVVRVAEIAFNAALSQSTDREFAQRVLAEQLGAAHVSVGADFRFGKGRMGDVASLSHLGAEFGFGVDAVSPVTAGGGKISSTSIREAIVQGNMDAAARMLTRPWAIEGEVLRGFARGRGIGFPTANVALVDYVRPRLGVYAVRVAVDGVLHTGVASVGVNPTVGALPEPVLEAHLFDFDADLYGQRIEVQLVAFLRDEAKFDSMEAMTRQIEKDAEQARNLFA